MSLPSDPDRSIAPEHPHPRVTLGQIALAFLRIGTVGFGRGPGMLGVLRGMHFCRLVAGDSTAVRKMRKVE
jgi:hypothetical protein